MSSNRIRKSGWRIGTENTALVVIDMQRAFVDEGAPLECPGARDLVPKINQMAAICRKKKIPVIFVKANRCADLSDSGLMLDFGYFEEGDEMDTREGRKGNEFYRGLEIDQGDYIIPKIRYSALIRGSSELESLLHRLKKDQIMICGVATDVCVGATAMDAMMLGFKVFLISDLTATFSEERQKISLEVYDRHFAKVMSSEEIMKELGQST